MDLNTIALWFAVIAAASLFSRSIRGPTRAVGWLAVSALVLAIAASGYFWFRSYVGYAAGSLAVLLIAVPARLSHAAASSAKRFQFRRARHLATIAAALHPFDNWPSLPQLFLAYELAHDGRTADAEALLQVLARNDGRVALAARAQRLRILERWQELKSLAERSGLRALSEEPTLLVLYLRALGELGEVELMAEFTRAQESTLSASGSLEAALLYLFAFTGHVELTRRIVSGEHQGYTEDTRRFWLALAQARAGDSVAAREAFGRLRSSSDAQLRERARSYWDNLQLPRPGAHSSRVDEVVKHFASTLTQREELVIGHPIQRTERLLVSILIAINVLVYLVGSWPSYLETRESFIKAWGFTPRAVLEQRHYEEAFTYLFVHAGALHLIMNMVGLWVLGPFIERAFGRVRFALIYACAGLTGTAVYLVLEARHSDPELTLVGASGCIMGMLGATGAVMLRAWFRERTPMAGRIFVRLLLVVALQVVFDATVPQVAGLAHMLGLAGGFFSALLLSDRSTARRAAEASVSS